MPNIIKKAVIYCRVSTKEQVEEGNSLSTQEKICRDYALKHGYEIVEVFIEQGESAKTAMRTELQRLLNYCSFKKNSVSAVIAYKIDRISRNTDDYSQIRLLLKRYGVEIKSTSEYFENTPAGRFMENIIANVAQFDNDVRTERSVGGMKAALKEGRYVWSAPLGYNNAKVAGKSNIVPNHLAPLIKRAFEKLASGLYAVDEIHREISKEGLVTKSNKTTSKSHFHAILRNSTYAGRIHKFGEHAKGTFEPIISEALFESVQYILKGRKRTLGSYQYEHPDFPLRRFVTDSKGNLLTGGWSKGRRKKYAYYRFNKSTISFGKEQLESMFKEYFNSFRLANEHVNKLKAQLTQKLVKTSQDRNKSSYNIRSKINSLKQKENQLIQKNLDGYISDSVLQEQLNSIEKEILDLHVDLSKTPVRNSDPKALILLAVRFMTSPGDIWQEASFLQKLRLQWFNFPLGVVLDEGKFRTTKMCSIFKLKNDILAQMSYRVPSKEPPLNNPDVPTHEPSDSIWWQIESDLVELDSIFNGKPQEQLVENGLPELCQKLGLPEVRQ